MKEVTQKHGRGGLCPHPSDRDPRQPGRVRIGGEGQKKSEETWFKSSTKMFKCPGQLPMPARAPSPVPRITLLQLIRKNPGLTFPRGPTDQRI